MTAKALGIEFILKNLDLFKEEHMTPEFLKINPQHTIPTLVDNGFSMVYIIYISYKLIFNKLGYAYKLYRNEIVIFKQPFQIHH